MTSRSRRVFLREVFIYFPPSSIRGRGEAGRPMRPIAACAMIVVERTRVSQVTPESPGTPRAVVLQLITRSCVRKICQNVRTGGFHQPPVAGSEPVRARRPQEPAGERGTDPVSSSTRTVAWALSPDRARKG